MSSSPLNHGLRALAALFQKSRGRLPDFLCLGAQRAGSTYLHDLLSQHPNVYVPPAKEIHYFSLNDHRSLRWYASWFSRASSSDLAGDVTPYYLFHPRAPAAIAEAMPGARLIILLRDPVSRALSGYFHARRHGMEPLGLEAAFDAEDSRLQDAERQLLGIGRRHHSHQWHSYLSRSRYHVQLDRYFALFPASQILLVRSEDFFANPQRGWRNVQEFLGLPPMPFPDAPTRRNGGSGEASTVEPAFRLRLRECLADTYESLRLKFGITWDESDAGTGANET